MTKTKRELNSRFFICLPVWFYFPPFFFIPAIYRNRRPFGQANNRPSCVMIFNTPVTFSGLPQYLMIPNLAPDASPEYSRKNKKGGVCAPPFP